jgi:hypothetical protein
VVTLLGDRAWWLPAWLDRALPNVSLEGRPPETVEVEPEREKALVSTQQRALANEEHPVRLSVDYPTRPGFRGG